MLSQEHLDILLTELRTELYNNKTVDQAYELFHATSETVSINSPIEISISTLLSKLSLESIGKLVAWPSLPDLRNKIIQNDKSGVVLWGQLLLLGGIITQNEFNDIYSYVNSTENKNINIEKASRISIISSGVGGFPNKISIDDFTIAWNLR